MSNLLTFYSYSVLDHRFWCYSNPLISDKLINLLNLQMYQLLLSFFRLFCLVTRKMVRIGIIGLALSDPHFCILSRDCFNLSREYFSLWAIKTSLDRNASAVLDPEVLFSRVARHFACLAFCKLQAGIFQRSVLFID